MKKLIISFILIGLLIFYANLPAMAGEMTSELRSALQFLGPDEEIPVIVTLFDKVDSTLFKDRDKHNRRSELIKTLRSKADSTQKPLKVFLENRGAKHLTSFWIINGMAVTAKPTLIRELEKHPGVESIRLDGILSVPELSYSTAVVPEWNLNTIRTPEIWNSGYTGEGVVIASMDTGVDASHPALSSKWRGGTNSWFDPYNEHGTPYDPVGHGTQTMGVMVGGSKGGTAIGVAPGAKWIAVKIFNDAGAASYSSIHQGFQWLLDPDGDPDTNDAPDVVNNSWGLESNYGGCITEFENDILALKAADIAVVFSAGNGGPGLFSSLSPANYQESFSVGATDINNIIAGFSSRGPSACDGSIYPGVVAPGVDVKTSDLTFGGVFPDSYVTVSGTSIAAPHVSGIMALLLSAFPGSQVPELEAALKISSIDLGAEGPDNNYGYGLVDGLAAYNYLASGSGFPPSAVNDSYLISEDTSISVDAPGLLANDNDPKNYPLSAVLETEPVNGTLTLNSDGSFTYEPDLNFNGTDYFTYKAYNGELYSNTATVSITLTPVQDPPLAADDTASTSMKTPVTINVIANDYVVDYLTAGKKTKIVIVTKPEHGKAKNKKDGTVIYKPKKEFRGIDSFTYRLQINKEIMSNIATVTVTID